MTDHGTVCTCRGTMVLRIAVTAVMMMSLESLMLQQVAAASCSNQYVMQFKSSRDPGDVSYIDSSTTTVRVTPFQSLPPVTVYLTLATGVADLALDGLVVQVTTTPLLRLGGDSAQLAQGQAIFRALQVQQALVASQTYTFTFQAVVPFGSGTQVITLTSPPLVSATPTSLTTLRFGNYGYFYRSGQTKDVPIATPLPLFRLELYDALGQLVALRQANVSICYNAAGVVVSPSVVSFTGSTDVSGLMLTLSGTSSAITPSSLMFQLTSVDGVTVSSVSLSTGILPLVSPTSSSTCSTIAFDASSSFIPFDNYGNTAVLGVALPSIVIQCLTPALTVDASSTGQVVITAVASGGAVLTGDAALVIGGVATFKDLAFTTFSPPNTVVTFSATISNGSTAAVTRQLSSGALTVSTAPIKARHLAFAADSTVQESKTLSGAAMAVRLDASNRIVFPLVSLLLLDSAYQTDHTAFGVIIDITVVPVVSSTGTSASASSIVFGPEPGATSMTMVFAKGAAKKLNVVLLASSATVGSSFVLQFTDRANIRASLRSSVISVTAALPSVASALQLCYDNATSCLLRLEFGTAPDSLISAVDQSNIVMTVGKSLSEIRVYLQDTVGLIDATPVFPTEGALYVFSGSDPLTESYLYSGTGSAALKGIWTGQFFSFPCLRLNSAPSRLIRLQFGMFYVNPTTGLLQSMAGISMIRTGFLTVVASATSAFGIQFVNAATSFLRYEGQSGTALVQVALPQVQIQVVDSAGDVDTTVSGLLLTVASSSGSMVMDGGFATISSGIATITSLRFTSSAQDAVITFTVSSSTVFPYLSGASISSGRFQVSQLPVYAVSLGIRYPTSGCSQGFTCPTHAQQSLTFATLADVQIQSELVVLDANNQPTVADIGLLVIEQTSDQVYLGDASDKTSFLNSVNSKSVVTLFRSSNSSMQAHFVGVNTPIYVAFQVTVSSTFPQLLGAQVTIGPITITALASLSTSTCDTSASAPVVVVNVVNGAATVDAANSLIANIAFLMGVDTDRITLLSTPTRTAGIATDTTRWEGSRVLVRFTDPSPTSSNRDSAVTLAAALVGLRPSCDAPSLNVASIYYLSDEVSCDPSALQTAIATAASCAQRGYYSRCQCYQDNVISSMGLTCAIEIATRDTFASMCQQLADCQQSQIITACSQALKTNSSYVWAFAVFGAAIAAAFLGYQGVRKILLRQAPVRLHRD